MLKKISTNILLAHSFVTLVRLLGYCVNSLQCFPKSSNSFNSRNTYAILNILSYIALLQQPKCITAKQGIGLDGWDNVRLPHFLACGVLSSDESNNDYCMSGISG